MPGISLRINASVSSSSHESPERSYSVTGAPSKTLSGIRPAIFPRTGRSLKKGLRMIRKPSAQGYKDSNLEMTESESAALPFGYTPMCFAAIFPATKVIIISKRM